MVVICIITMMLEQTNSVILIRSINKLIRDDLVAFVNVPFVN